MMSSVQHWSEEAIAREIEEEGLDGMTTEMESMHGRVREERVYRRCPMTRSAEERVSGEDRTGTSTLSSAFAGRGRFLEGEGIGRGTLASCHRARSIMGGGPPASGNFTSGAESGS